MGNHTLEALDLGIGELERVAASIITVGLEFGPGSDVDDVLLQIIKLIVRFTVLRHGQIITNGLGDNV